MRKYKILIGVEQCNFLFNFVWNKDNNPTKNDILTIFKNNNDKNDSFEIWEKFIHMDTLRIGI